MIFPPWLFIGLSLLIILQNAATKCLTSYPDVQFERHFYVAEYDLPINIELSKRTTHILVSHILKILLNEVVGYQKVFFVEQHNETAGDATTTLQKISACHSHNSRQCKEVGVFGPEVMINLEVWMPPGFNLEGWISTGQVEDCGPLGPIGRSGWFVAEHTVNYFWKVNNTAIDNWRAFKNSEVVALFDLTDEDVISLPERRRNCGFEECGEDGIYRPKQCKDTKCATLLADYPVSSLRHLNHVIMKFELLVNVIWVGDKLEDIVETRTTTNKKTLFYYKKPMTLSAKTNFAHISFPDCEDDTLSSCEYEVYQLEKVVWSKIKTNAPYAFHLIRSMLFTQGQYMALLRRYYSAKSRGFTLERIACDWTKENYILWDDWLPDDIKNRSKIPLYIGGIFPMRGVYSKESSVIPAAKMAANFINENATLLQNYKLTILEQDGQCAADEVIKSFITYVTNSTYKTMVGILGPACSDTVEPIAGVAKYFNTIIISYSAERALFSSRERNPYFFRTVPENNQFRYVYLKLLKKLGYTRVAALTEDGPKHPEYLSYLQNLMQDNGIAFIVNRPRELKSLDMKPYLKELKNKGARIIIGDFYDHAARAIMCDAYQLGMTASDGYVWFLPYSFSERWYDTDMHNSDEAEDNEQITCTTEQMTEAVNGHISLAYKFFANSDTVMQEGITVGEWLSSYKRALTSKRMKFSNYAGYAYDAIWVYALALDALFKENDSHLATLHTRRTSRRLVELLNETNFNGVTGPLFFLGSSRISDVIIWQWINKSHHQIGAYHPFSQTEGDLDLNETDIVWLTPNGKKPEDVNPGIVVSNKFSENSYCGVEILRKVLGSSCHTANIVANILGAIGFVIIVVIATFCYKRRYDRRMRHKEERMKELGLLASSGQFALDEWEMPRDHIVINRKLGEGAFGTVYGGEAHVPNKGWIAVAVKTLKTGAKPEEKLDFLSEAEVMKQFDHINIVKLVGVCTMGEPVYTVMEFMLYGDLKTYLLSRRNLATESDRSNNDEVSDRRLTNMALDVARGLSYLADLKFVHRDLACRNCLVNSSRNVKIADFGMCRALYDSDYYRNNKRGMLPIRWMAPESLIDGLVTPLSDVWSYGVVLYEIVTFASFPYQGFSNNEVIEHIKNHNTLPVPKECKPELNSLLRRCWSRRPEERPGAAEIVEILANNSELISPCLDVPMASVEVEDTKSLELKLLDRSRGHSLSAVWQNRKHTVPFEQNQTALMDLKAFSNKKGTLHESFKKAKREARKEQNFDFIRPQITYL